MLTIRNVLVAIDLRAVSPAALEFARYLSDVVGAPLHVLHVTAMPFGGPEAGRVDRESACRQLAALLDETDRTKRHVTVACVPGSAPTEIVRYAAEHDVDIIVTGTHAHGPSFQMVRGSVTELVLGSAPCAVLAVKEHRSLSCEAFDPPAATLPA